MSRPDYYGFGSQRGQARRRSGWRGSVRLGTLFAVLVGVNIYVFFFRGGTSINEVLKSSSIGKKSVASLSTSGGSKTKAPRRGKATAEPDDSIVIKGTMKGHLGLSSALTALKINAKQVVELIAALRPELNFRALRPEHSFEARLDPRNGKIRRFTYRISAISTVAVTRKLDGALRARKLEQKLTIKEVSIGGQIDSSLGGAISKIGESSRLVAKFIRLFSWDINWLSDPRGGDEFRIIVEKEYLGDKFYRYGNIIAAEYKGKVGRFQAFYFKPQAGPGGYYIPEGRSIRRAFLKTPLNFRRISSKYNSRRFHPVLHRTKGHFGVDYAAARGTPIWASADGVVVKKGRFGGAGNMVVLKHAGRIQSLYMHMSRFPRGLKVGQTVKQRQVIGYVGSTGLATGPHLHYGIKVRGRNIDPLKFKVPKGRILGKHDRIRFLDSLPTKMATLEAIPLKQLAQAAVVP